MRSDGLVNWMTATLAGIFLSATFLSYPARAQVTSGAFLGTIQDSTGAVVPRASVTLSNAHTGLERKSESDPVGDYRFSLVPLGTYKLRVDMSGFASAVSQEFELHVGEEKRVDFKLAVAQVATTVEVQAEATAINTTNSERGLVLGHAMATDLPLNFREFTQLILLAPGAQVDFRQRISPMKTNISVNGLRSQNANLVIDGTESNDIMYGGTSLSFYDPDALQEFKTTTTNYSAELRGSSYNTRVVTKSGTNSIHGSVYEFVRNEVLDARNFFEINSRDPVTGAEIPGSARKPFRRNQFGATLGGPIVKDRLFWFVDYSGLRERLTTTGFAAVPTADERNGIVQATNPVSGQPDTLFIDVDPRMEAALPRYPLPNLPNGPLGARTFYGTSSNRTDFDQYTIKLDWQRSSKDNYSARWTVHNQTGPFSSNIPLGPDYGQFAKEWARNASFSNVHIFTPTLINEFRAGYSRNNPFQGMENTSQSLNFVLDGSISPLNWGGFVFGATTNTIQLMDTVTHLRGRHTLKAGYEFRNIRNQELIDSFNTMGQFQYFPNSPTVADIPTASGVTIPAGSRVGSALITFLQAAPDFIFSQGATPGFPPKSYTRLDQSAYQWFAQDDIRVTPNLTINLGVRYEYHSVYKWRNRGNVRAVFEGANVGDYIFNPSTLYDPDYNNFSPRIGFAYRVQPKTVLRGGFAIFTITPTMQGAEGSYTTFPSSGVTYIPVPASQRATIAVLDGPFSLPGVPYYDTDGQLIAPGGPGSPQDRVMDGLRYFQTTGNRMATNTGSGTLASNFRSPYVINWNMTLEREFHQGIIVSGAYVGNSGVALQAVSMPWCAVNATNSVCAPLQQIWFDKGTNVGAIVDNSAHSTYHSLQIEAKKTSAERGFTFTAAYTLGKNLSDRDTPLSNISGAGNWSGPGTNPLNRRLDKGPSIYDVRHIFSASAIYAPPFSRWIPSIPTRLTEGWQFVTLGTLRSGLPFNIVVPGSYSGFGSFNQSDRPDLLSTPPRASSGVEKTQWFSDPVIAEGGGATKFCGDPSAQFFCAAVNRPGTLGRGVFRGPGFNDIAFSIFKTTSIRENIRLQFRAEFFNIFNFVNFDQPNSQAFSPGFGRITSTISTPSPPVTQRQIQVGLKFLF